jgi:hypothetical protein
MRSNLFWLNDEQWRRIEPHLPTDVRGKDRVDDRRRAGMAQLAPRQPASGSSSNGPGPVRPHLITPESTDGTTGNDQIDSYRKDTVRAARAAGSTNLPGSCSSACRRGDKTWP